MHKQIAITGSQGTIGSVLRKGLSDYQITEITLPDTDVRDYEQVLNALRGNEAIIHLAWNSQTENHKNNKIDPDNKLMADNVYKAALETGVKRVIMASSVHADSFIGWRGPGLMTIGRIPVPDSPYGADKIAIEKEGRKFASLELEVICIRFGGVNPQNSPAGPEYPAEERAAWLSHNDLVSLIKAILVAPEVPKFALMYAVSNNAGRIHDTSNPFGWKPKLLFKNHF